MTFDAYKTGDRVKIIGPDHTGSEAYIGFYGWLYEISGASHPYRVQFASGGSTWFPLTSIQFFAS